MADFLRDHGHEVTIAFPATRSHRPDMNTKLSFKRASYRNEKAFDGYDCVAVGTCLPELEFTYSTPSDLWQTLIDGHDFHVVVSGTTVLATPLAAAGVPHLIWCASDVFGDRSDRQKTFGLMRRLFDRHIVMPKLLGQQRSVLRGSGQILAISSYTRDCLQQQSDFENDKINVLPIPTDMEFFQPPKQRQHGWTLGFAGRLADPRKNAPLLFDVIENLHHRERSVNLLVTGERAPHLIEEISRRGLDDIITFEGELGSRELLAFYQKLDVLLIPSFQEGHAIVGVEAMACGVPVVSTRCGGPEGYIQNNYNGYLTEFDVDAFANRISDICGDIKHREKLSNNARRSVAKDYGMEQFSLKLKKYWHDGFGSEI